MFIYYFNYYCNHHYKTCGKRVVDIFVFHCKLYYHVELCVFSLRTVKTNMFRGKTKCTVYFALTLYFILTKRIIDIL